MLCYFNKYTILLEFNARVFDSVYGRSGEYLSRRHAVMITPTKVKFSTFLETYEILVINFYIHELSFCILAICKSHLELYSQQFNNMVKCLIQNNYIVVDFYLILFLFRLQLITYIFCMVKEHAARYKSMKG